MITKQPSLAGSFGLGFRQVYRVIQQEKTLSQALFHQMLNSLHLDNNLEILAHSIA